MARPRSSVPLMIIIRRAAVAAALCLFAATRSAPAQQPTDRETPGLGATRPALEAELLRLAQVTAAGDSSPAVREWARQQAAAIRARLEQGDFLVGEIGR